MVNIIIKPVIDDDFYLIYNTTGDMPTQWGSRADIMQRFRWADEAAMRHTDLFGTSDLWNLGRRGWGAARLPIGNGLDPELYEDERYFVKRDQLRQLCESWHPITRRFRWTPTEDTAR